MFSSRVHEYTVYNKFGAIKKKIGVVQSERAKQLHKLIQNKQYQSMMKDVPLSGDAKIQRDKIRLKYDVKED